MQTEEKSFKPEELKGRIEQYKKAYEARFKRNQYANNTIIGASILLTILIAITGTSPALKIHKILGQILWALVLQHG
jgi:rhamnose utilization protein RhaD (predicted bifunctional aldolase and dehydrogenase)